MQNPSLSLVLLLAACSLTSGCGGEGTESGAAPKGPEAAIESMLALAEAGDWKGYVEQFYGEKQKMTKPQEQTAQIAERLEKHGPKLIEMLKGCVGKQFVLSEDGTVATWPNGLRLHKDGGAWGFHL